MSPNLDDDDDDNHKNDDDDDDDDEEDNDSAPKTLLLLGRSCFSFGISSSSVLPFFGFSVRSDSFLSSTDSSAFDLFIFHSFESSSSVSNLFTFSSKVLSGRLIATSSCFFSMCLHNPEVFPLFIVICFPHRLQVASVSVEEEK